MIFPSLPLDNLIGKCISVRMASKHIGKATDTCRRFKPRMWTNKWGLASMLRAAEIENRLFASTTRHIAGREG
jgi:hypothetical protein